MSQPNFQPAATRARDIEGSLPRATQAVFFLGRAADLPFQYYLYTSGTAVGVASALGLKSSGALVTAGPGIFGLGSTPSLLMTLYTAATLRHMYWALSQAKHAYPVPWYGGVMVCIYNTSLNVFDTVLSVSALTNLVYEISQAKSFTEAIKWYQWLGVGMFAVGMFCEVYAETTRARFKSDPRNKGKVDNTKLFSVVRHPNFMGFWLWRVGAALATGSAVGALVKAAIQTFFFSMSIKNDIGKHMAERYGEQWKRYTERVPYQLLPGLL